VAGRAPATGVVPPFPGLPERDAWLAEDGWHLLDTAESACYLGISPRLVKKLIANGALASLLIGRTRRVPLAALRRYVTERLAAEAEERAASAAIAAPSVYARVAELPLEASRHAGARRIGGPAVPTAPTGQPARAKGGPRHRTPGTGAS
jgi:excisionase family DNA binding protein